MTDPGPVRKATEPKPWMKPVVEELPRLTELTLQSGGGPEGGDVGGGGVISGGTGSTIF